MFVGSWIVVISGLAFGALVFAAGGDAERARFIETIGTFAIPFEKQSLVLFPFDLINNALRL